MPLPRLSRLFRDAAKSLCAGPSPVARVPVTPSGVFVFRVLCVPTFSVGKTRGALSPPRQPITVGRGAQLSCRRFSSRITGHRSRVTGRLSQASVRPSPHARFSMLAPTSRLSTLELSTLDWAPSGFSMLAPTSRLSTFQLSTFDWAPSGFSMLAPTSRLSTLELSTIDCQLLWRLFFSLSPLECAVTQEHACNSFGMRSYKSLDLKSPGMNSYKKHRGWGPLRPLQTLDLVHIFHCEGQTIYKSLDLKSPGMNSYKKPGGWGASAVEKEWKIPRETSWQDCLSGAPLFPALWARVGFFSTRGALVGAADDERGAPRSSHSVSLPAWRSAAPDGHCHQNRRR